MKKFILNLKLNKPIANLYRDRHVLIVCLDENGKVILGDKPDFYPEGITRLIGGGINKDEDAKDAALRELHEEIGIKIPKKSLKDLCEIDINAEADGVVYHLITYLYKTEINSHNIKTGDDVSSVSALSLDQLKQLADKYESLPSDLVFCHSSGYTHLWSDYGKVYGPIHRIVYELLINA